MYNGSSYLMMFYFFEVREQNTYINKIISYLKIRLECIPELPKRVYSFSFG